MTKFLNAIRLSTIVATIFYHPLIKLYHYLENNAMEATDLEEQECK
ncbi:MAG: hypothetical protein JWQ38_3311 [Flavipsychrobacter sp.]|nr:hypothetical protein [Flavipsychrobacter sp.]